MHLFNLKLGLIISILFTLTGCQHSESTNHSVSTKYSSESAELFLSITDKLQNNQKVAESDWKELFKSRGYQPFLNNADSAKMKQRIREAAVIAFDHTQKSKLDSMLTQPLELNRSFAMLVTVKNFAELKQNLDKAQSFIADTNFDSLLREADLLALKYLPNVFDSVPDLYDVHLICAQPDAKVKNQSIMADLNMLIEMGPDETVKLFAHEFHHNYLELVVKPSQNLVVNQIRALHTEGLADLIDKPKPPLAELNSLPESVVTFYNNYYEKTPMHLFKFDSLVVNYINGRLEKSTFEEQIDGYFKFGGHPTGYYMILLIEEQLGTDILIENFNNTVQFIRLYNQVASTKQGEHVLSDALIEYLIANGA